MPPFACLLERGSAAALFFVERGPAAVFLVERGPAAAPRPVFVDRGPASFFFELAKERRWLGAVFEGLLLVAIYNCAQNVSLPEFLDLLGSVHAGAKQGLDLFCQFTQHFNQLRFTP